LKKINGKYDIKIDGYGIKANVSEIQNTDLKSAKVSTQIPTVANYTQGEVVKFANEAVTKMGCEGCNVLVEGREATLNYIRSPHRFDLILGDIQLIGKRRLAQKMMADLQQQHGLDRANDSLIVPTLQQILEKIAATWRL